MAVCLSFLVVHLSVFLSFFCYFLIPMRQLLHSFLLVCLVGFGAACSNDAPPQGAAVRNRDSLPVMVTYGVSKLISDSGVTRYKIISEEWRVFDRTRPQRQEFVKGVFLERYDDKFNVNLFITADTAYWYDQNLWELRGRVRVRNEENGTLYRSEQLYWDMGRHEFYSNVYMRIVTPDRDIQGDRFRSDEQMTRYEVSRSRGFLPVPKGMGDSPSSAVSAAGSADSLGG